MTPPLLNLSLRDPRPISERRRVANLISTTAVLLWTLSVLNAVNFIQYCVDACLNLSVGLIHKAFKVAPHLLGLVVRLRLLLSHWRG